MRSIKTIKRIFSTPLIVVLAALVMTAGSTRVVNDFAAKVSSVVMGAPGSQNWKDGEITCELRPGVRASNVANRYGLKVKRTHEDNQYLFEAQNPRDTRTVEQLVELLSSIMKGWTAQGIHMVLKAMKFV